MAEFHLHGGQAIIKSCLEAISTIDPHSFRVAERGEFSRRAFENNKMDLTEVEGLNDLINAETEFQRLQAFGQMSGRLGNLYESWRSQIIECLAHVEATIDFGEDAALDEQHLLQGITSKLKVIESEMKQHLNDKYRGQRLRDGLKIAIVGSPNAGKSSLLNILADRPAAIVSSVPGTTRDIIEVSMDLDGFPITLADTAGIRDSGDEIEQEGVRRATDLITKSDLRMLLIDSAGGEVMTKENLNLLPLCELVVWNKSDLDSNPKNYPLTNITSNQTQLQISCKTKKGMEELMKTLASRVSDLFVDVEMSVYHL